MLRILLISLLFGVAAGGCRSEDDDKPAAIALATPRFVRRIEWVDRGVWLKGDLHTHSRFSDGSLEIDEVVAKAVEFGCDVVAVTDHADLNLSAATPEYFAAIEASRRRHPETIILAGLEWNVPRWGGREHATALIPSGADERGTLTGFKLRFDDLGVDEGHRPRPDARAALAWLDVQLRAERSDAAVIIYNHPYRKRESPDLFQTELKRLREISSAVVGFEGGPGHQRAASIGGYRAPQATVDRWDPAAAEIGGDWDALLRSGVNIWGAVANSDFHDRGGSEPGDYWPGEFAATWLHAPRRDAHGALEAVRHGAFFGVHGDIARNVRLTVQVRGLPRPAVAAETIHTAVDEPLEIRLQADVPERDWRGEPNRIDQVELIITNRAGSRMITLATPDEATIDVRTTVPNSAGGTAVRARGRRIIDGGPDLMFYTNAVLVKTDGGDERTIPPPTPVDGLLDQPAR